MPNHLFKASVFGSNYNLIIRESIIIIYWVISYIPFCLYAITVSAPKHLLCFSSRVSLITLLTTLINFIPDHFLKLFANFSSSSDISGWSNQRSSTHSLSLGKLFAFFGLHHKFLLSLISVMIRNVAVFKSSGILCWVIIWLVRSGFLVLSLLI